MQSEKARHFPPSNSNLWYSDLLLNMTLGLTIQICFITPPSTVATARMGANNHMIGYFSQGLLLKDCRQIITWANKLHPESVRYFSFEALKTNFKMHFFLPLTSAGWILHYWEMKASSLAECHRVLFALKLLNKYKCVVTFISAWKKHGYKWGTSYCHVIWYNCK